MKKILFIIIIASTFSCGNNDLEIQLIDIYKETAENNKDSITIENVEVLKYSRVDYDYVKNIQINNLNYSIDLTKKIIDNDKENERLLNRNIDNRTKLIKLNPKEKETYLAQIELDEQILRKTQNDIKKNENSIALTHQKIVLIKAELGQKNESEFDLIEYVFKGRINNEKRIDTMSLLKSKEYEPKFIKNSKFTNYIGK